MKTALVVPSIREEQTIEFLDAWRFELKEADVHTYIVEDNETKTFQIDPSQHHQLIHLAWDDAPQELLDCINVKSPGCRQIGFWRAYHDECDVVVTLDDDVRPVDGPNLFLHFQKILVEGLPVWVDPLLNYRSRGYPESNVGNVQISGHVGSFLNVPDVDGDTQLEYEIEFMANPPRYQKNPMVVPQCQLIPINGGIFGFRREIIPYIHYTLWCPELKYRRFDDIWMGIILKRWMDVTGRKLSYGSALVEHIRASDAEKNAEYEIEGKKWNEVFWEELDKVLPPASARANVEPDTAYQEIVESLISMDNAWAQQEGRAMKAWRQLFSDHP